jgi:hypothetical protein
MRADTPSLQPVDGNAEWLHSLALQALVYAWPLYETHRMRAATSPRRTAADGFAGNGPESPLRWCNTFIHERQLLTAGTSRVVMPNNDTLYTNAWLDLSDGPLVISVPDTGSRFYVLGLLDYFTNPFAHVGTRTTGNGAGRVLVTPPGWAGEVPAEFQAPGRHIASNTPWVWIIGRILVDGPDDVAQVAALQDQFALATLTDALAGRASPAKRFDPAFDPRAPFSLAHFLHGANAALAANPAPAADGTLLSLLATVGLGVNPEAVPALLASPDIAQALARAEVSVRALIDPTDRQDEQAQVSGRAAAVEAGVACASATAPPVSGWRSWRRLSEQQRNSYGADLLTRALVARQGIGALSPDEAIYPRCGCDSAGRPLHGGHRYLLHFAPGQLPPVQAFWSITMYDNRHYLLVDNPIGRYAIGDRTPGLRHDADGGLTLVVQHAMPLDETSRANWLPAPADGFFLCLRAYLPQPEMIDGRYRLPELQRLD